MYQENEIQGSAYDDEEIGRLGYESFLQTLVDNTSDALVAINPESTVVYANPAVETVFGYEPGEVVGESLTMLIPERLRKQHLAAIERYVDGGDRRLDWDSIELPGLHREGHEVPIEMSFREIRRDGKRLFTGVLSDITKRRQVEVERRLLYSVSRAVAEADTFEDGLQAAIEQVCDATDWGYGEGWVPEPDGDHLKRTGASFVTDEAFEPFQEMSRHSVFPPEFGLPGRVWARKEFVWMPDITEASRAVFPRTETAEAVGLRAGLGVPIVAEEEVVAVLTFYTTDRKPTDEDLVETIGAVASELGGLIARKRAEDELERERQLLERVIDTSPVGIYLVSADGELLQMNDRAERLLGVDAESVSGRPYEAAGLTAFDEDDEALSSDRHPVERVFRTEEAVRDQEHRIELADGTRRWVSLNAAPVVDSDGELDQVVVSVGDVTELKESERQLARDRESLRTELNDILERVSDAFFALDEEWRFTYANDRAETLIDATETELLGRTIWETYPETAGTTFEEEFRRAMDEQVPVTFEGYYPPLATWLEVNAYPSASGISVYFRDISDRKRHERTLTALHGATRDLMQATSPQEVCDMTVETATDVIDISGVAVLLFDDDEGVLEPVSASRPLQDLFGELPSLRPGEGVAGHVFVHGEPAVFDDVSESERVYNPNTPIRGEFVVPLGDHGVLIASSTEPGVFDESVRELVQILVRTTETALDRLEREGRLRERDQELHERNRQLTKLDRTNAIIRQIDRVLVAASSREEIESAVCDRLTDEGQFEFAWIGEPEGEARVRPRTWKGGDEAYLDEIALAEGAASPTAEPSVRAVQTRSTVVEADVVEDLRDAPWRKEALSRGFRSAIAVPLRYDGFDYGVLAVYAAESNAFDETTRDVFDELGVGIASAINAVETKRGLLVDRVVELELRGTESTDVLHRLSAETNADIEFEGMIPQSGSTLVFFTARCDDLEGLESAAVDRVAVEEIRRVTERDGTCLFQAEVTGDLLAEEVVADGGVPRTIATDGSELELCVDLPTNNSVREFVERLSEHCPDVELAVRRERDRAVETREGFRSKLEERLTDRQLEVLRTAYLSGYFEEPRYSTGSEIGAALGISQPTFNSHLRTAQRRLLSALLDDD